MDPTDHRKAGEDASHPHFEFSLQQYRDDLVIVRLAGEIDTDSSRTADYWLRHRIPPKCRYVVVDLSSVDMLAAAGVRVLVEHADRQELAGRRMLTVAGNPHVRRVLELARATQIVGTYDSVPSAIAACTTATQPVRRPRADNDRPAADEVSTIQRELFAARSALRTRTVIARALGMLQERYGLPNMDAASELLGECARYHDVQVHALARAFLAASAPRTDIWFPGRARLPAPSLSFFRLQREHRRNRAVVLEAFLDTALGYLNTSMGDVQLVEGAGLRPRMESYHDLPLDLVDYLADLDDPSSAAWQAAQREVRVIEYVPVDSEHAMFAKAGIHALQSTPLVTFDGECVGVVTTYHLEPYFTPSKLAYAKLDSLATETADWLWWYRRTVIVDALERLHSHAPDYVKR
ncbi:ANTAR domain-containing protein [Kibdelosporangium philippinense]|uniref:ANTAR domain-containing protein n=1 Tax=Kibdelosporangium philippinense TaxID=211113 RepID=A0ABS8Z785_9PSEU|nr:STAS domain-containing protein [Kibdelosporangium philippinense]MCE7003680.1 ANTAR domain-containing protein [Kibdelosporangium philippinense]